MLSLGAELEARRKVGVEVILFLEGLEHLWLSLAARGCRAGEEEKVGGRQGRAVTH